MQPHILLIGISFKLDTFLESALSRQGYRVSRMANSVPNLLKVQQLRPDLIIIILPSQFDLKPCHYLSEVMKNTPIMLLGNNNIQDRVVSLNTCANDYLCIPFATEEFLARVRAKLRRISWRQLETEEVLVFANLRLDAQAYEVQRDNQLIELTTKEFDLLKCLMAYPQQVLTHQQILDQVWPDSLLKNDSNILHVYIRYLRQKLKPANDLIQTVRGVGYVLKERSTVSNLFEDASLLSHAQQQQIA
ncbi:MAG: response regulator transcription factor [Leptolyngbyaceae cyanobacterium]